VTRTANDGTTIRGNAGSREFAAKLANRDRSKDDWRDAADLRRVAEAFAATVRHESELAEAVQAARDAGFSWSAAGHGRRPRRG